VFSASACQLYRMSLASLNYAMSFQDQFTLYSEFVSLYHVYIVVVGLNPEFRSTLGASKGYGVLIIA